MTFLPIENVFTLAILKAPKSPRKCYAEHFQKSDDSFCCTKSSSGPTDVERMPRC